MTKLISWNVNGLRACVGKNFLDFFHEADADVFCLQETKLQAGQIDLEMCIRDRYKGQKNQKNQKTSRQANNQFLNFEQRNTDYDSLVLNQVKDWIGEQ